MTTKIEYQQKVESFLYEGIKPKTKPERSMMKAYREISKGAPRHWDWDDIIDACYDIYSELFAVEAGDK